MSGLGVLTVADLHGLEADLAALRKQSEADWAAIVDTGGNLFAESGRPDRMEATTLCALAAGAFAATHELARRLGQTDFVALYHEGSAANILLSALAQETLLIVVFDTSKTNIGLVRYYVQQTSVELNRRLDAALTAT